MARDGEQAAAEKQKALLTRPRKLDSLAAKKLA
jgi:hypothetical protein